MSCDCNSNTDPCNQSFTQEGLSSALQNLITQLFGTITVTVDPATGIATWSQACSGFDTGVACFSRNSGEGLVCYLLRLLKNNIPLIPSDGSAVYDSTKTYCANTLVVSGSSFYLSKISVPSGTPPPNSTYWSLLLSAPAGPQGPQGPAGASGGGSAISFSTRNWTSGSTTALNTDANLYGSGTASGVSLGLISSYDSGKWFRIINMTTGNITITPTSPQLIGLPNSSGSATYVMSSGESILINNFGGINWYII